MNVAVVGSGAWGTALAIRLHKNGHHVTMWTYEKELLPRMEATRHNPRLPGAVLPEGLEISGDYSCVSGCPLVVMASPSFPLRSVCKGIAPYLDENAVVVSVTKGIEDSTLMRMSEVVAQETGRNVVVLTGPSHAEEVALDVPTGCLAACEDKALAEFVQDAFMSDNFRIYTSPDAVGAELGAALKNVIALCAGITDGIGFGDNTKAALMTRGIKEIARLGTAMGADADTFWGLSGIGDLIVTCTSMHSRNRRAGILIGRGKSMDEALSEVHMVVEGVQSCRAAYELAKKHAVEMPIVEKAYQVLYEGKNPKDAVLELMQRDPKSEN